ncbi:MAG: type II toxin-antitoxin system HicB family antitoxin [Oscillospiraceae bacterium]|nr:type II toxin-antitoxin system HicB family antitoxin [Oscillospiraceae bacterium]
MAQTQAHIKATNKYIAKAYDRVNLTLPKGQREVIRAYAEAHGMSLNGYINKLIAADMGEALTEGTEEPHNSED